MTLVINLTVFTHILLLIVPAAISNCNITLLYDQSSRMLHFINTTWDLMPVSHITSLVALHFQAKSMTVAITVRGNGGGQGKLVVHTCISH